MLTRALGHARMADGRPLVPDVLEEPFSIEAEDALVLSSDGLHDLVDDWEIGACRRHDRQGCGEAGHWRVFA